MQQRAKLCMDLLLCKVSVLSRLLPATSHRTSPTHVQGSSCLATRQRRNPHAQLEHTQEFCHSDEQIALTKQI